MKPKKDWRKIRCVVEVAVPPGNPSRIHDLKYQVERAIEARFGQEGMPLPRDHGGGYFAAPRVLDYGRVVRNDQQAGDGFGEAARENALLRGHLAEATERAEQFATVDSRGSQFQFMVLAALWQIILAVVFKADIAARRGAVNFVSCAISFGDLYGVPGEDAKRYRRETSFWMPNGG